MLENSPFISNNWKETFNKYNKFGLTKNNAVYDRTGGLPHFLNISPNLHPIPPSIQNYNKSFFEVSEQRAKEILSLNKPINVMWSGGIDSTYILFILKYFSNDPDQVRVYGTYNSIIESGDLFDRRLKHEFKYNIGISKRNDISYNSDDCIFVSGMCGNQLFGPTDDMFGNTQSSMFHHTLGTPETIYESYTTIDPNILEFLDPIIKSSPKKIETVADLRWLCIFNLDWYTAIYEHKIMLQEDKFNKITGFFDSYDFQSWAVNTKDPFTKIPGNPNTHRWQMREILSDLFGEEHYAVNKTKKISNFSMYESSWLFLLENRENIFID
jgi:hypothetical protein